MRLEGKIALITGAARGIGRAIALRFAEEGAAVVVDDINVERGEATAQEIQERGGQAAFVQADVSNEEDVRRLFRLVVERFGGLDVLVNNAVCATHHVVERHWQPTLDVVLKGTYDCSLAAIPLFRARGGGSIVNIASVNGLIGLQGIHPYSAAKGGVIALTKSMAVEYGKERIRVNAICPGTIQTEVWGPILQEKPHIWEEIVRFYPLGRLGRPEDVANAALFLASDEADFITGAILTVDGGLTAGNPLFPI
ncbi:MAG: short chain dehydrogenase [Candidatus Poribacteria bacterium]|nr:MAG: short chain dehydrogenase [Candidatus Poribacteria bacterium]